MSITVTQVNAMTDHEVAAYQAKAWSMLPEATADEARYGKSELFSQVAFILDRLPSAKRAQLSTQDTPGWRGANAIAIVVLSDEDAAAVGQLRREWMSQ